MQSLTRLFLACAALALLLAGCGRTSLRVGRDGSPDGLDARVPDGGGPECTFDEQCDDGIFCNGIEQCGGGRCFAGPPVLCDDGVECTLDSCDPRIDACTTFPDARRCADGEVCDPDRGCVVRPCTSDAECDDGIFCNGADACVAGTCRAAIPVVCDDGNECTDELCDEASASCVVTPRDRDGDGFVDAACGGDDCDDTTPFVSPTSPESCTNGIDDDCDGDLDCEDGTCAGNPICRCAPSEACGSGTDADCDGLVDCADPDCLGTPACEMPCMPRELGSMIGMAVATGTTVGQPNRVRPSCSTSNAPDVSYRWTAPSGGAFTFDTQGSTYDTMLTLQASCSGPELACNDDTPGAGTTSRITLTLMPGQSILIVVDGWSSGMGNYVLNIREGAVGPELCGNRLDDDGDGLVDCADGDCAGSPACCMPSPESCTNGVDDDCDRAVDCADFDCRVSPACCVPRVEICNDRVDQDCDRLVDCADPDCASSTFCCRPTMELCTGGRDEDCDGRTDCTDADCASSPSCCIPAPEICDNGRDDDCDMAADCADPVCASAPSCCTPSPELCTGGRDDDCDRLIDCADPDCGASPACCVAVPEVCGNGDDDDCDLRTDCADPDCVASPACCTPSPELCTGGADEDCDRRIDCGDPDCASAPACCVPAPEICDNGRDDDCDAAVDCADPVCATSPACCMPSAEICDNGRDDDCDARSDCSDIDCALIPPCAPPCPDRDLGSRTGLRVTTGTTAGAPNRFTPGCRATSTAPERTFTWTAPAAGEYAFDTIGSAYDTVLTLRTSCTGPELACDDDGGGGQASRVRRTLTAGERILIVVDGFGRSSGAFVLNLTQVFPSEVGRCANGLDDDVDRAVDCGDSDCFMDPACTGP